MEQIKTIIIDDEQLSRDLIREYLAHHDNFEVVAECRDAHEAYAAITQFKPHLIFLDIQMPQINGFELLEMLEEIPQVIFSTAYDQYAIKAFEVNAVDYLLKPYDEQRFNVALDRALRNQKTDRTLTQETIEKLLHSIQKSDQYLQRLMIKQSGKIVFITCDEIEWIEAKDDYAEIHSRKESYLIQQSMNSLETRLNPDRFIRAHRSYIVNMDCIKEIVPFFQGRHKLILKNGKEISLSRSGAQKIKRFGV